MKKNFFFVALAISLFALDGCHHKVGPTEIWVEDPSRHYFPIVMDEKMDLLYKIVNVGDQPFIATDVQPSCGCIKMDSKEKSKVRNILPPGDSTVLHFQFDGSKNIGYVQHTIRIFGNVKPNGVLELKFDLNVVPPADYIPDYEESFEKKVKTKNSFVDGKYSQKGYSVD
ncbi:MAG: DUF1573 domain-containing protein [Bacteroidales bacterium]|nr:DUF1573 domain-containing protein [Bacteroidales bacterium]